MRKMEAFQMFNAIPSNIRWGLSAFNEKETELVVRVWGEYLTSTGSGADERQIYAHRFDAECPSAKKSLKQDLTIAKENKIPIRMLRVDDSSTKISDFVPVTDWIGQVTLIDDDRYEIVFKPCKEEAEPQSDPLLLSNSTDNRERVFAAIVLRQGQSDFRKMLLDAYGNKCAITGCNAIAALEAAHIVNYNGKETNRVDNGLLLRADIHTLFDLKLIWIEGIKVRLAAALLNSDYKNLNNKRLRLPQNKTHHPAPEYLKRHAEEGRSQESSATVG